MKILILYASAGAGHRRAAEALAEACRLNRRRADVLAVDILDFTPKVFRRTYAKGYVRIVRRAPELWGYMYSRSDKKALLPWRKYVRSVFNKINAHSFFKFYDIFSPDMVVCTHFMPVELLSTRARQKRLRTPLFCTVTDFAVHALWIVKGVACYYVATEEARRHLIRRGHPANRVKIAGIPIDPVFAKRKARKAARKRLGLAADVPVVLSLSGGFGVGPAVELVRSIGDADLHCQWLVVAGANKRLKQKAERAAKELRAPVRVFGFVDNMHEMMDAADLVISKPGGLTSSEVLAKGLPLIVVDPIPGQEQRNCEYLLEAGAAARLFDIEDAAFKVGALLNDRPRFRRMQANARRLGRPHAAAEIVTDMMKRCSRKRR